MSQEDVSTSSQEGQESHNNRPQRVSRRVSQAFTSATATMTNMSFDCDYYKDDCDVSFEDDASSFTFFPVDEPELEVTVAGIFSSNFTPSSSGSLSGTMISGIVSYDPSSSLFIAVSDNEEEDGDASVSDSDDWLSGEHDKGQAVGHRSQFEPERQQSVQESEEIQKELSEREEDDCGDEDDDYESRKRKEEASLDEEQLRKKRRVEEEERIARNQLWKQSLKRSMFRVSKIVDQQRIQQHSRIYEQEKQQ